MNGLENIGRRILALVYPDNIYCMCCGDTIDSTRLHGLCDKCVQEINWDVRNPFADYMEEFAFDDVWPVVRYGHQVRGMLHGLKLHGKTYMAANMGKLLAERIFLETAQPDALVSVPLFRRKEKRRGYNQADLLARYASKESGVSFWKGALEKKRETASVRMSGLAERRSILKDAFQLSPAHAGAVKGKTLLLVDDVCTTGSTAHACAGVLKAAGAERVILLCFAAGSGYRTASAAERSADGGTVF